MAYSQAVVLAGGVAHVPILITVLKFLDSKTLKLYNKSKAAAAVEKEKAAAQALAATKAAEEKAARDKAQELAAAKKLEEQNFNNQENIE